jgi:hypothetical protein
MFKLTVILTSVVFSTVVCAQEVPGASVMPKMVFTKKTDFHGMTIIPQKDRECSITLGKSIDIVGCDIQLDTTKIDSSHNNPATPDSDSKSATPRHGEKL